MVGSVGCGPSFRFMWAAVPLDVGRHYGDVGRRSGDVWGSRRLPPGFAALGPGWMGVLPLLFHSRHLGAKRFPVAFRYLRFAHFLDDVGEVLQTGDRRPDPGVDHGDILAGTSEQDCPVYLLH